MHTAVGTTTSSNRTVIRYVLLGGFFAGLADFIYPTVKTLMAGNPWTQPWKGVASGLLGQAARDGGMEVVVLGAALHWFICISAAALLYLIVSHRAWHLSAREAAHPRLLAHRAGGSADRVLRVACTAATVTAA